MGLFICAKCNCVENTALGWYWSYQEPDMLLWDDNNKEFKGKPLCSECMPLKFNDGTKHGNGKWHNRFPKQDFDEWKKTESGSYYKRDGFHLRYQKVE